jgi:hypothetical protein
MSWRRSAGAITAKRAQAAGARPAVSWKKASIASVVGRNTERSSRAATACGSTAA